MKANELMVGDWVRVSNENSKVADLMNNIIGLNFKDGYDVFELSVIEPILLTNEILEKNGFARTNDGYECNENETFSLVIHEENYNQGCFDIWIAEPNDWKHLTYSLPLPKCVHELQHALRLCGIEKEIEL